MLNELIGAAQSVKALGELLRAAKELSNYNEIVAAVAEVNAKLMQAQAVGTASLEKRQFQIAEIAELEKEVAKLKAWQGELERFQLHKFVTGALALAVKPGHQNDEPVYYLCTTCASKQQKTILQPVRDGRYLRCHPCGSEIKIIHSPTPGVVRSKRGPTSWMGG